MRLNMRKLYLALLLSLTIFPLYGGWFTKAGTELYLLRSGGSLTHRAVFDYASDCELIAKTMNKAEPNVNWHCK